MFEPDDDLTVLVGFLHRYVRHVPVGTGSVPAFLSWLDGDDVTGTDLLHGAAATGDESDAVGDVEV